jgi:hypothetical protein
MKDYFERRLNRCKDTGLYKVTVPELGIEVVSDTEVSAIVDARKEVLNFKPTAAPPVPSPNPQDTFGMGSPGEGDYFKDAHRYMTSGRRAGKTSITSKINLKCRDCGNQRGTRTHAPDNCGLLF